MFAKFLDLDNNYFNSYLLSEKFKGKGRTICLHQLTKAITRSFRTVTIAEGSGLYSLTKKYKKEATVRCTRTLQLL